MARVPSYGAEAMAIQAPANSSSLSISLSLSLSHSFFPSPFCSLPWALIIFPFSCTGWNIYSGFLWLIQYILGQEAIFSQFPNIFVSSPSHPDHQDPSGLYCRSGIQSPSWSHSLGLCLQKALLISVWLLTHFSLLRHQTWCYFRTSQRDMNWARSHFLPSLSDVGWIVPSKHRCSRPKSWHLWLWLYLKIGFYRNNQVKMSSHWVRVEFTPVTPALARREERHRDRNHG